MKRYLVFEIERYYPKGGMGDFVEDFNTLEEALALVKKLDEKEEMYRRASIYDLQERKEVELPPNN